MKDHLINLAKKKARSSDCRYKVAAIGLNKKDEVIGTAHNQHRFSKKGGTIHAEIALMKKCGPSLKKIILVRVGKHKNTYEVRPIEPCVFCARKIAQAGIKVIIVEEDGCRTWR